MGLGMTEIILIFLVVLLFFRSQTLTRSRSFNG